MGVRTVGRLAAKVRPLQDFAGLGRPLSFMQGLDLWGRDSRLHWTGYTYSTTTAVASQPEEDGGVDKRRAEARLVLFRAAYLSTHGGRAGSRPVRTAWRSELRSISP